MDSNNLRTELRLSTESELALLNSLAFTSKLTETQIKRARELDVRLKTMKLMEGN